MSRITHALIAASLIGLLGCQRGNDGPKRYALKGTVTLNGELVPAGAITFEPSKVAGNSGPAASTKIVNGAFTLPRETGHVGGEQIAILFPPEAESGGEKSAKGNFKPMKVNISLPKSDGEIEVKFVETAVSG